MSGIPDFSKLHFEAATKAPAAGEASVWTTPEGVDVRSHYGPADRAGT